MAVPKRTMSRSNTRHRRGAVKASVAQLVPYPCPRKEMVVPHRACAHCGLLEARWHPVFSDRQQELVLIGVGLDGDGLRAALAACLLTDTEFVAGQDAWRALPDPFPAWDLGDLHDHAEPVPA